MNNLLQTLRNLGPARLAAIGGVGLLLIGFFVYLMTRLSTPEMELLYAELQPTEAAAIAKKLEEAKVPFTVDKTGTKIMVAAEQVGPTRMRMAAAGLPSGGSIGYELFDKGEGFGATSFMQNINHLRALEGEMARTVQTLNGVQSARVHLVLPKRELFARQQNPATASIFIKLRPGAQLSRENIQAIQHLIAASVPNLDPSRISIVDDKGTLLARGTGNDSADAMLASAEEKKVAYESRIARIIEDLLGRTVGYGKVRAEVSADLDFDRITTQSEIFDPESQVVRSTQTVTEANESHDRDPLSPVTVDQNLPTAQSGNNAGPISQNKQNRSEETINYEISRTTKNHVRESGQVRRLSVAVLVDGTYSLPKDGNPAAYQPRPEQELESIKALVRSAVGLDAVRGDTLEVINMRFWSPEDDIQKPEELFLGMTKDDLFRIAEMVVLGIVAVLIILLVIRPLITRAFEKADQQEEDDMDRLLADQSGMPAALAAPTGALAQDLALEAAQADEELEQMIDINRVEGRVRASSLRKVGEIVEKHPEEAVSILRNWLYQES
ncbi:flagellar M-ring protein FliF [Azospirillum brasilense]|uniref:Flagellar M-ring protein n=3 Tax=Azospirillum TaxID=191 RepID=A0A4D8Q9V7_AZOBR|nr:MULTISPECIES: flagellar basal-body MS-ring/collar protein FliF [Azospirillum]ALJ37618.1 flagellar M-ring protein FliF [Azospirillum brasilense]MDW7553829.1 flagellar basal-body MS-ring/collar protein FliF [Azospirillum brasilense]MDW7592732.1 flagellar basal-body MS-ring/collar protein FliF [Azospirillum brasilense]MDW7628263.1 flagellar basal-body MS-ring/collar protein FliF [Azospirillum brasilense]MDX5952202.1 flagellar basal-body MS-ring/collar protein FliF [Azospirillum brasilense]